MDASNRQTLHSTGLSQPNGITIDYAAQKIYWTDRGLSRIESSYYDGSGRSILLSASRGDAVVDPFSITIERRVVYWSDMTLNAVFATNKEGILKRSRIVTISDGLSRNASAIVTVSSYRQSIGIVYNYDTGRKVEFSCTRNLKDISLTFLASACIRISSILYLKFIGTHHEML